MLRKAKLPLLLVALVAVSSVAGLTAGLRRAEADDGAVLRKANATYREAVVIIKESRELEGDEKQEASERALNLLQAAQELLEPIANSNAMAEDMMADVQSLIYWTHKMMPISFEKREEISEEFAKARERRLAEDGGSGESEEERRQSIAREELERIQLAERTNPDSLEILAQFFRLADEYSDTRAGLESNRNSIRLQKLLWGSEAGRSPESGDYSVLVKRLKNYLTFRKRSACHKCKGEFIIKCKKCGGDGWIEKYYGSNKFKPQIDWSHSRKCVCNPDAVNTGGKPINGPNAGQVECSQSGCFHGFMLRHFAKVVWDYRPPDYRERVLEKLDGTTYEAFIEALAAVMRPNSMVGADDTVGRVADKYGIDSSLLRSVAQYHAKEALGRRFTKFKTDEIRDGIPEIKTRLLVVRNGKVVKTYRETLSWVWADGEWFVEEPEDD